MRKRSITPKVRLNVGEVVAVAAKSAVFGACIAGPAWLVGSMCDGFNDFAHKTPAEIQKQIDSYKKNTAENETAAPALHTKFGDTCLKFINFYQPGGPLEKVDADTMVSDIANNPNHPCGLSLTEVRVATTEVVRVEEEQRKLAKVDINEKYAQLDHAKKGQIEDANFPGGLYAGEVGAGFGFLVGFPLFLTESLDKKKSPKGMKSKGN